jgi:hypothetical protein
VRRQSLGVRVVPELSFDEPGTTSIGIQSLGRFAFVLCLGFLVFLCLVHCVAIAWTLGVLKDIGVAFIEEFDAFGAYGSKVSVLF